MKKDPKMAWNQEKVSRTKNPYRFEKNVFQYSLSFDPDTLRLSDLSAFAIPLPEPLASAADKRKIDWILGRHCARKACQAMGWDPEEPLEIPLGSDGAPVWPDGLVGSITHTRGFAAAAIARVKETEGLGVDSEVIMNDKTRSEVKDQISSPGEAAWAESGSHGLGPNTAYTLLFSAKESIFKCLHPFVGRFFSYGAVEIQPIDPLSQRFCAKIVEYLSAELTQGVVLVGTFNLADGYIHTALALSNRHRPQT